MAAPSCGDAAKNIDISVLTYFTESLKPLLLILTPFLAVLTAVIIENVRPTHAYAARVH